MKRFPAALVLALVMLGPAARLVCFALCASESARVDAGAQVAEGCHQTEGAGLALTSAVDCGQRTVALLLASARFLAAPPLFTNQSSEPAIGTAGFGAVSATGLCSAPGPPPLAAFVPLRI